MNDQQPAKPGLIGFYRPPYRQALVDTRELWKQYPVPPDTYFPSEPNITINKLLQEVESSRRIIAEWWLWISREGVINITMAQRMWVRKILEHLAAEDDEEEDPYEFEPHLFPDEYPEGFNTEIR